MKPLLASPQRILLSFGALFGALVLGITPPFLAPDEQAHFYRAYQISEGQLVAEKNQAGTGAWLPASLQSAAKPFLRVRRHQERQLREGAIRRALRRPLAPAERRFVRFETTAVYSPVPYLPQAAGIALGRALGLGPTALLYAARLGNLLVALGLTAAALKLTPVCAWAFLLLALMPMAVFQMSSASADAFTNAIALLFTSLVLRLALARDRVRRRDLMAVLLTSLALSMSKHAYAVLMLLVLAIPTRRFRTPQRFALFALALLAANAAALGGWLAVVGPLYTPPSWVPGIDPSAQLRFVLERPLWFAGLVSRELWSGAALQSQLMVGSWLGSLDAPLPLGFIYAYQCVLLAVSLSVSEPQLRLGAGIRVCAAATILVALVALLSMAYLYGNPLGASGIGGIQGRYFIPLAPLVALLLYNQRLSPAWNGLRSAGIPIDTLRAFGLPAFLAVCALVTLQSLAVRYQG